MLRPFTATVNVGGDTHHVTVNDESEYRARLQIMDLLDPDQTRPTEDFRFVFAYDA